MTMGCGTGKAGLQNRLCLGVSGGGTFKNDQNEISSVVVDYSGQATNDGTNMAFLDWDGTLSAVNYTKHTSVSTLVLTSLTGVNNGGGFVLTADGSAQVSQNGAAPASQTVQVTLDIGKTSIKITGDGGAVLVDAKTGLVNATIKLDQ